MPNYSVEGKLGTGKSKFCVMMAREAAVQGRRIAGNLDIYLDKLTPRRRSRYTRLPDKPSVEDLYALGHGNPDSYDEERNGRLFLDELGTWLNARGFQDKQRAAVLDWLVHSRKYGWDVFFIVQNTIMIDKQVREGLIEHRCVCRRMDRVRIPYLGHVLEIIHPRLGRLPRWHRVVARMDMDGAAQSIVTEKWDYRGTDLHAAYDTRQVFRADYPHGTHSVLPPWDWSPQLGFWARVRAKAQEAAPAKPQPKPKHPLIEKIVRCDPDRAWHHVARLERLGLLAPSC